nr:probable glutathione S-transferase 7 [Lytechinus pictus]
MPTYKFFYYDGRARGEPVRMLFALANQKFEDIRFQVEGEEWKKAKSDKKRFPFGAIPVLDVSGRLIAQSRAIYRYLAREFGYYGSNNWESTEIDEFLGIMSDFETAIRPAYLEKDAAKRTADLLKARDTTLKHFFEFFVEKLHKGGGKYYVGNKISLADLLVFNLLDVFLNSALQVDGYLDPYPSLVKYYQSIKSDSPLSSYLKTRKVTPL